MRRLPRAIAIAGTTVTLFGGMAHTAQAAEPANQACLGHDISGYAQGGAQFGGFISGLASTTEGVGSEIQAHQAGAVPDTEIPNSCND
jgi:hypothetical protein